MAKESNNPVGIFDSGIGGLTVLHVAMQQLPGESFVYYADTEHVPYGIKEKDEVRKYILEAAAFFAAHSVKALVIACNTATSIAVNDIRSLYDFPVIGMEPAVKPAVEKRDGKRVLVFATPLTLKEQKFKDLVAKVDNENMVDMVAMPELVQYAEQFQFDREVIFSLLSSRVAHLDLKQYGTVVLGCTHYPFFKTMIQQYFNYAVDVIDGNEGTVRHLKNLLQQNNLVSISVNPTVRFFNSGIEAKDCSRFMRYLDYLHRQNP